MRNNKLTVIVVPNFERKVRRFRTTKATICLVLIAIICAMCALYLWREWTKQIYDEQVVRLANQLTDERISHNDALTEKEATIEALQQKIIQLTEQTEEVRSKLAELQQLELILISLTGVSLSDIYFDEEMNEQEAADSSLRASGGAYIPAEEEGIMELAAETGTALSQLSISLSRMSDKLAALIEEIEHLRYLSSITPTIWPTSGRRISSGYGYRIDPFTRRSAFHSGIDIEGKLNDDVYATAAGTVAETGYNSTLGNYIIIDHTLGIRTLYGHLRKILVDENASVDKGDRIGLMGSTGRSTGPHLHYEVHRNGETVDPGPYLQETPREG
jgi:murein DD-endopeptidase MepM/ murein hydrolase activator NlpD